MKRSCKSVGVASLSRRGLLLATGGASLAVLLPRELLAADGAEKAYHGTYKFDGGDKERDARDAAIEGVVSELNILIRSIARDRLKAAMAIQKTITITSDATNLSISLDSLVYAAPIAGGTVKVTGVTGDKLDLSYGISSAKIDQKFKGDEGGRTNTFTKSGDKLVMNVRVYSDKLPKDLKFKLTYKKS
ncbi:MAG: hypothetical protein R3B70_27435 [Polyangiaceae bacterium]